MLFRSLATPARKVAATQQRNFSKTLPNILQTAVWGKSTVNYIAYVLAGCVIFEGIYGGVTNYIWESYNYGKLYHQIDWSKFKSEDDEDEE